MHRLIREPISASNSDAHHDRPSEASDQRRGILDAETVTQTDSRDLRPVEGAPGPGRFGSSGVPAAGQACDGRPNRDHRSSQAATGWRRRGLGVAVAGHSGRDTRGRFQPRSGDDRRSTFGVTARPGCRGDDRCSGGVGAQPCSEAGCCRTATARNRALSGACRCVVSRSAGSGLVGDSVVSVVVWWCGESCRCPGSARHDGRGRHRVRRRRSDR